MNKETALDLTGVKVCVQTGTTTELNLADYFRVNNMKYEVIASLTLEAAIKGYDSGQCNALTADVSALWGIRLLLSKAGEHVILPDVISKEPLGPAVRQGDMQWLNIVKWVSFALVNAEELGVSSKNIDEALKSEKPDVKRLVGIEGNYGERMGVTNDWAARIIRLVGNYGEIYERNVGIGCGIKAVSFTPRRSVDCDHDGWGEMIRLSLEDRWSTTFS
jgi:general L-amino acid transport system substrate-binding protein